MTGQNDDTSARVMGLSVDSVTCPRCGSHMAHFSMLHPGMGRWCSGCWLFPAEIAELRQAALLERSPAGEEAS